MYAREPSPDRIGTTALGEAVPGWLTGADIKHESRASTDPPSYGWRTEGLRTRRPSAAASCRGPPRRQRVPPTVGGGLRDCAARLGSHQAALCDYSWMSPRTEWSHEPASGRQVLRTFRHEMGRMFDWTGAFEAHQGWALKHDLLAGIERGAPKSDRLEVDTDRS